MTIHNQSKVVPSSSGKQATNKLPKSRPISRDLQVQERRLYSNQETLKNFAQGEIQPKLKIGAVGDAYEREADRVAELVINMPNADPMHQDSKPTLGNMSNPRVQRQVEDEEEVPEVENAIDDKEQVSLKPIKTLYHSDNVIQRQEDEEPEEEELVQLKAKDAMGSLNNNGISADGSTLSSRGSPLSAQSRQYFEPRFGHDFGQIRIHNNTEAHQLSQSLNAKAFSYKNNIVFGQGYYQPDSQPGRLLLAHELTHTLQQTDQSLIQREELSEERRQQIKLEASKRALTDLNHIKENIEAMTDAERDAMDKKAEKIRAAARKAIERIENADVKQGGVLIKFLTKMESIFNYEPYIWLHVVHTFRWNIGSKSFADVDGFFHEFANSAVANRFSDGFIHGVKGVTKKLSDHRYYTLDLLATDRLEQILKEEKISKADFFKPKDKEAEEPGGVFVSPSAKVLAEEIEENTGEEVDEEKMEELSGLDEETLKLITELLRQGETDVESAKKKLSEMSKLELEVLKANMLLNEDKSKGAGDRVLLDMGDVQQVTQGSGLSDMEFGSDMIKSLEEMLIDRIKSSPGGKSKKVSGGFSLLEKALKKFEAEVVMVKGLLKGAAKKNPEDLAGVEAELGKAFEELIEEIRAEMMKSFAWDIVLAAVPGVGLAKLLKKIQKIIQLIDLIQRVLAIKDEITAVQKKLESAQSGFEKAQKMARDLESFSQQDVEEKVYELIEQHNLLEVMHLPELEGLSEEEAQEKLLSIIRDIPAGIGHFSDMYSMYTGLGDDPEKAQIARLGVQAMIAGHTLSPVVAFLALKLLENLENAKSQVGGKSLLDRLTKRRKRKSRKSKKSAKDKRADKKKKSEEKLKKIDTRNVEYIKSEVEDVIKNKYKRKILDEVEKNENSLGNHSWTLDYYKDFIKDMVKDVNRGGASIMVKTWAKEKKKKGAAKKTEAQSRMPPVKARVNSRKSPWSLIITTSKAKAKVEIQPDSSKFKAMDYASFSVPGIAYETSKMTGSDKPNKRRKISKWLFNRKRGYQKTYGVDGSGNELRTPEMTFIRMRGANKKPGFLRFENGFIIQGLDPNAYKHFLGKKLSGRFASRANSKTISEKLPPGYHAYKGVHGLVVSNKSGSGMTMILNWDQGLLAEGNKRRVEKPVMKKYPTKSAITAKDDLSTLTDSATGLTLQEKMINNMFENDSSGRLITPAKVDKKFKAQGRTTLKSWQDYIGKKEDLRMRPKKVEADLGYTKNKDRGSLGSKHLPELLTGDDKGHVIAARFNGEDALYNLLPMQKAFNQKGAWAKLEHKMAQTYIGKNAKPNHYIHLKLDIDYTKYVRRPDKIKVTATEKPSNTTIFNNEELGNPG